MCNCVIAAVCKVGNNGRDSRSQLRKINREVWRTLQDVG
eukprot:XP_001704712.1 Hypothetical protein GL50803_34473 [Giardia lamblia ATCC 50803]